MWLLLREPFQNPWQDQQVITLPPKTVASAWQNTSVTVTMLQCNKSVLFCLFYSLLQNVCIWAKNEKKSIGLHSTAGTNYVVCAITVWYAIHFLQSLSCHIFGREEFATRSLCMSISWVEEPFNLNLLFYSLVQQSKMTKWWVRQDGLVLTLEIKAINHSLLLRRI